MEQMAMIMNIIIITTDPQFSSTDLRGVPWWVALQEIYSSSIW